MRVIIPFALILISPWIATGEAEELSCYDLNKSGVQFSIESKIAEGIDAVLRAISKRDVKETEFEGELLTRFSAPDLFQKADEQGNLQFLKNLGYRTDFVGRPVVKKFEKKGDRPRYLFRQGTTPIGYFSAECTPTKTVAECRGKAVKIESFDCRGFDLLKN
jgi:hypothetical protein